MSELKPCPFCGENDAIMTITFDGLAAGAVVCKRCFFDMMTPNGKPPTVSVWNTRPVEDKLQAELARRDEIIARLKEDAERLASTYVVEVFPHEWVCRGGCHHWARFGEQIDHTPDCPITLHRALMKELE